MFTQTSIRYWRGLTAKKAEPKWQSAGKLFVNRNDSHQGDGPQISFREHWAHVEVASCSSFRLNPTESQEPKLGHQRTHPPRPGSREVPRFPFSGLSNYFSLVPLHWGLWIALSLIPLRRPICHGYQKLTPPKNTALKIMGILKLLHHVKVAILRRSLSDLWFRNSIPAHCN